MRVNTMRYEAEYGHKPRGFGSWWFDVTATRKGAFTTERVNVTGLYSEARARAVAEVKEQIGNATILEVEVQI